MNRLMIVAATATLCWASPAFSQDPVDVDHSQVVDASTSLAHLSDLLAFKGRPHNMDAARPVTVLINHGYMVGFSEVRRQPIWAAYREGGKWECPGQGLFQRAGQRSAERVCDFRNL